MWPFATTSPTPTSLLLLLIRACPLVWWFDQASVQATDAPDPQLKTLEKYRLCAAGVLEQIVTIHSKFFPTQNNLSLPLIPVCSCRFWQNLIWENKSADFLLPNNTIYLSLAWNRFKWMAHLDTNWGILPHYVYVFMHITTSNILRAKHHWYAFVMILSFFLFFSDGAEILQLSH